MSLSVFMHDKGDNVDSHTTLTPSQRSRAHGSDSGSARARPAMLSASALAMCLLLAACGGSGGNAGNADLTAEQQCQALKGQKYGEATISDATFSLATASIPENCLVVGQLPKALTFNMRLPTQWNQRIVFTGGGGFDGVITDPSTDPNVSPNLVKNGYVTIVSNHGHDSGGASPFAAASWALDEVMFADYATESVPRVLASARLILKTRYGATVDASKAVFEGCSGGGRRALMQAQRHPELFDGIVARAPANAYNPQFLWYQKIHKQLSRPGAALSAAKIKTISNAAYAKCDAMDGLADRIIGRPDACQFDPVELQCTGAESDSCLTPVQVESARAFYAPTSIAGGRYTWPGFPVGGEEGSFFTGSDWGGASSKGLMEGYLKYMVARDPSIDPLQLKPEEHTARIDELVRILDATDPDLTQFKQRGDKMILWTGQSDWLITANNATEYYGKVVEKMGGQAATDEFLEYYTAPGVGHCALGNGADSVDLVGPVFEWLEKGTPPRSTAITASTRYLPPGQVAKNRPLCRYPQYPHYVGGDPNAAASFVCTQADNK